MNQETNYDNAPAMVKAIVEDYYKLDITTKSRQNQYIESRAVYYYILREKFKYTLGAIAKIMNKNHATILHFTKQFDSWINHDRMLRYDYSEIEARIDKALEVNKESFRHSVSLESFYEKEYFKLEWKYKFLLSRLEQKEHGVSKNPEFQLTND